MPYRYCIFFFLTIHKSIQSKLRGLRERNIRPVWLLLLKTFLFKNKENIENTLSSLGFFFFFKKLEHFLRNIKMMFFVFSDNDGSYLGH